MNHSNPHWPRHAFLFKGGGGSASTPIIQAPPAPAASATAVEVQQAKLDARTAAKNRKGIQSTILAGNGLMEQSGGSAAQQGKGLNVLLGGG